MPDFDRGRYWFTWIRLRFTPKRFIQKQYDEFDEGAEDSSYV